MYLLGAETRITWVLEATASVIVLSDLDLLITNTEGVEVYLNSPIQPGDFTAPTELLDGEASYLITPDTEGLWTVRLVTGTSGSYTQLSKVEMQVLDNSTTTNPTAEYIKTQVTSEAIKLPCRTATTVDITLSGLQTVATVVLADGDRVLVKNQNDLTENGLYNASAGVWIRTQDFNEDIEVTNGVMVADNNDGVIYNTNFSGTLDIGVTEISFFALATASFSLADLIAQAAYAKEWSQAAEDLHVSAEAGGGTDPDDYSALHFAAKAYADLLLTNADVVTTGNNVTATADNVVLTGDDLALTNADVILTNDKYTEFDDRYLGSFSLPPSTLNDGITSLSAAHEGIEYWNSTSKDRWTWNGSSWGITSSSVATSANNVSLSDIYGNYHESDIELAMKEGAHGAMFHCHEASTPNLQIHTNKGIIQRADAIIPVSATLTTLSAAHAANDRVDVVYLNLLTSSVSDVTGIEDGSKAIPTTPTNCIPLAYVLVDSTVTQIYNADIIDARPFALAGNNTETLVNKELTNPTVNGDTVVTVGVPWAVDATGVNSKTLTTGGYATQDTLPTIANLEIGDIVHLNVQCVLNTKASTGTDSIQIIPDGASTAGVQTVSGINYNNHNIYHEGGTNMIEQYTVVMYVASAGDLVLSLKGKTTNVDTTNCSFKTASHVVRTVY